MASGTVRGLGDVAPHVKAAAYEIAQKFNVWNIGGRATSGHINGSDHYTGHALDVMVMSDKAKGDAVTAYAIAQKERWNVKYVIWYKRIWENGQWTHYVGSSPHTDHVHISFHKAAGSGGSAVDTGSGSTSDLRGCLSKLVGM